MNKDILEGKWHEYKGEIKEKWGKLTDDDLTHIDGKREKLAGKLQTYYGYSKDKAEEELEDLERSCGCECDSHTHTSKAKSKKSH
jgi:uncharacterized protein YjbJ (UPF0337 family)